LIDGRRGRDCQLRLYWQGSQPAQQNGKIKDFFHPDARKIVRHYPWTPATTAKLHK